MEHTAARPSDRFIPYYIALFFVMLMALIFWFVWLCIRNYPGEVVKHAYQDGLYYNQAIAHSEAQAKLGWHTDLTFNTQGKNVQTILTLADKSGKPITNAEVKAWFIRPTHAGFDQSDLAMNNDGNGHYSLKNTLPLSGEWNVHLSATCQGQNYQLVRHLELK
ncbi:MAG TPA: FixH family protein [Rickettsiales bacterium]|nr:FixH family protein [Rickettsiales bacterium]